MILQFGTGRFLRAFVDRFVQHAQDAGHDLGGIVVVQSTASSRADALGKQGGAYHVVVRGYENGELVDRVERVTSIRRALNANSEWSAVLEVARSPELQYIISNTTEAGYALDDADQVSAAPPQAFPAKLTRVLWERFQAGGAPVTIIPCELFERNADKLRALVVSLAERWQLPREFVDYLVNQCVWLCNLVDCIVTPGPADHALAKSDPLLIQAEPYTLWAIERVPQMPPLWQHPAICITDDLAPYYLRKVRILNGVHTAMAAKFRPVGFETVQQVLADRAATRWVRGLLYEEIVPTIAYRVPDVAAFADEAFDRLRNPYLSHKLSDIALHHEAKVAVRLKPTYDEYMALFKVRPRHLSEVVPMES
ncbi:MAG: hypothetical protein JNM18_07740 [Planctomycetaceae bacterium]|nr:hypothetical protein [Planctomycetaceae bacterium]